MLNGYKNNRFSPIGISYGYFSFDEKTALTEIRAEINQDIVIGTFNLQDDLKIIDFTKKHNFSLKLKEQKMNPFDETNFNVLLLGIYSFITNISKPILEKDTLLEYVPTQIMAEYIWSHNFDGFIFDSSQNEDGKNIVLFDYEPEYKNYKTIKL